MTTAPQTKDPITMSFDSAPVGVLFRWQSNLGGQDVHRKISATHLRNLATGNEYAPTRERNYFGPQDSVIILKQHPRALKSSNEKDSNSIFRALGGEEAEKAIERQQQANRDANDLITKLTAKYGNL